MRCRLCRYMLGNNEMQAVRGYWRIFRGLVKEEYLIIYPGGYIIKRLRELCILRWS